jgi:hypothetical protein
LTSSLSIACSELCVNSWFMNNVAPSLLNIHTFASNVMAQKPAQVPLWRVQIVRQYNSTSVHEISKNVKCYFWFIIQTCTQL